MSDFNQPTNPTPPALSISPDALKAELHRLLTEPADDGLFEVKEANLWIEDSMRSPVPRMLFSEFWHEGELCILFADTNLSKSILAVQIGDSISRGAAIPGFRQDAGEQKVLYFDFELSKKQFENRYSIDWKNHYRWSSNFLRAEVNPNAEMPEGGTFEQYLAIEMEKQILARKAKVLIIDNITYLKTETERAKEALPLMKFLKALKSKYGLSILALAHTPKRDLTKPITVNDLQGSKMLINFCDSAIGIGLSHQDKNIRYLKQIKERNTEKVYDADHVCICQVAKPHNFLMFELVGHGEERHHLRQPTDDDKTTLIESIRHLSEQGMSQREIARELGVSKSLVNKLLKD